MNIAEAREKLAALLAPAVDTDPDVLLTLVDAIEPPALMLGWGEPWLEADTACFSKGRVVITCVAARMNPGEGVAKLEELVGFVLGRLRMEPGVWAFEDVSGPRVFVIAKTSYLAARVTVRVTVN